MRLINYEIIILYNIEEYNNNINVFKNYNINSTTLSKYLCKYLIKY